MEGRKSMGNKGNWKVGRVWEYGKLEGRKSMGIRETGRKEEYGNTENWKTGPIEWLQGGLYPFELEKSMVARTNCV